MRGFISFVLVAVVGGCGATSGLGGSPGPSYLVYVRDRQGSVVAAVDDRGTKVWETHDDAYGLRLSSSGTEVPREFLDQPFDEETGFYRFQYRTYDPATAQWLSPDPMLISDQEYCTKNPEICNPYAYGGDRPGEWPDPDGREVHQEITEWGRIFHGTVGVFGRYAADVAADLQNIQSLALKGSQDKVDLTIHVYSTRYDVPRNETPVDANLSDETSTYHPETSTVVVGRDTLASAKTAAELLSHELFHANGGQEGYLDYDDKDGTRHSVSLPGEERSIMGAMKGDGPFGLTLRDKSGMDYPDPDMMPNRGLDLRGSSMDGDLCRTSQP